jgi:hypothetical protein
MTRVNICLTGEVETPSFGKIVETQKIVTLRAWEEVVGTLNQLFESDGLLVAEISNILVELPSELKPSLSKLLGHRMALLRTDIPQKEYLIRGLALEKEIGTGCPEDARMSNCTEMM